MAGTPDKGKFSVNIGDGVLEEAMAAVEKRHGDGPADAAGADVSPEGEPAAASAEAPIAASPEGGARDKELEELKLKLEFSMAKGREMMDKVKDAHEKMLRAVADLENFKKRAQKEKEEVLKFGVEKLLKDLLPIPDNLDR